MKNLLRTTYSRLASLTFGIWLLGGVMVFLAVGSFLQGEGSSINEVPLLLWLREVPPAESWWLWAALLLLVLLALNTVLCSIDSLTAKWQGGSFLSRIAPQAMHLGFLCIMVAHLQSATGSFKQQVGVRQGSGITFPDGSQVVFTDFSAVYSKMGMPTSLSATLSYPQGGGTASATISPNHPFFYQGHGIYLKDVAPPPMQEALVEVHKEPGAGMALAGGLVFTVANLVLLFRRRGRDT
jgi:hypothetical protein